MTARWSLSRGVGQTSAELKALVHVLKTPEALATRWRADTINPRHSPFPKSRPAPPGGVWRSVVAKAGEHRFMVFAQVQEARENFKACLAVEHESEWRVLVRMEFHGGHPGLHIHDWCSNDDPPVGGRSFEAPYRRPLARSRHRQLGVPSLSGFWKLALDRFRVIPYASEQEDLL